MPRDYRELLCALEPWQGFLITTGAGIINAILCATSCLSGGEFVAVTSSTVSVYLGARAWAHAKVNAPQSNEAVS